MILISGIICSVCLADTVHVGKLKYREAIIVGYEDGKLSFTFNRTENVVTKPIAEIDRIFLIGNLQFNQAEKLFALGEYDAAEAAYKDLPTDPEGPAWYQNFIDDRLVLCQELGLAQEAGSSSADQEPDDEAHRLCSRAMAAYDEGHYSVAIDLFYQAAERGQTEAMFGVGCMYLQGHGVKTDDQEAAIWLRRAARKGHVPALYSLGYLYANGRGVPKKPQWGFWLFSEAARAKHINAMIELSRCYRDGRGTEKNPAAAAYWSKQAALKALESFQGRIGEAVARTSGDLAGLGKIRSVAAAEWRHLKSCLNQLPVMPDEQAYVTALLVAERLPLASSVAYDSQVMANALQWDQQYRAARRMQQQAEEAAQSYVDAWQQLASSIGRLRAKWSADRQSKWQPKIESVSAEPTHYQDLRAGFRLTLPAGFEMGEQEEGVSANFYLTPREPLEDIPFVMLSAALNWQGDDVVVEDWAAAYIQSCKEDYDDFYVIETSREKINGRDVHRFVARCRQKREFDARIAYYVIPEGRRAYVVCGITDPESFKEYSPLFAEAAASFAITGDAEKPVSAGGGSAAKGGETAESLLPAQDYRDDAFAYSIRIPAGWQILERKQAKTQTSLLLRRPPTDAVRRQEERIFLLISDATDDRGPQAVLEQTVRFVMSKPGQEVRDLKTSDSDKAIKGMQALRATFTYHFGSDKTPRKNAAYIFSNDQRLCVILYSAPTVSFQGHVSEFEEALASLELGPHRDRLANRDKGIGWQAETPRRFTDEDVGFSVAIPKDWRISSLTDGLGRSEATFVSPRETEYDQAREAFQVILIKNLAEGSDLDSYAKSVLVEIKTQWQHFEVLDRRRRSVGDLDQERIVFSSRDDKSPDLRTKGLICIGLDGKRGYVIICRATDETFSKYLPEFERVTHSLDILKKEASPAVPALSH